MVTQLIQEDLPAEKAGSDPPLEAQAVHWGHEKPTSTMERGMN